MNSTTLTLVPVTLAEARRFVATHHRHNEAPVAWRFGVGLHADGELVGVATAGHPKARLLCDGFTLEVNRLCVLEETPNACSMLYAAICRAAKALGYRRVVTYTLSSEPGSSLLAAGFTLDAELPSNGRTWEGARGKGAHQHDLFGERKMPTGPKLRWLRLL